MMRETVTVTLETDDDSDELTLPDQLVQRFKEGPEGDPTVVGDIAMLGFAQQIHVTVHHAEEEPDEDIVALHDHTMELFEDRFGASFGELTGHDH